MGESEAVFAAAVIENGTPPVEPCRHDQNRLQI